MKLFNILWLVKLLENCTFLAITLNLAQLHNTYVNRNSTAREGLAEKWQQKSRAVMTLPLGRLIIDGLA